MISALNQIYSLTNFVLFDTFISSPFLSPCRCAVLNLFSLNERKEKKGPREILPFPFKKKEKEETRAEGKS